MNITSILPAKSLKVFRQNTAIFNPVNAKQRKIDSYNMSLHVLNCDCVNFTSSNIERTYPVPSELSAYVDEKGSIDDFLKARTKKENLLGEGRNSFVYEIPESSEYVIKRLKPFSRDSIEVGIFPDVNLGQAVWQSPKDPRLFILKKQNGTEHSVANWSNIVGNPNIQLTRTQAMKFYYDVSKIAQFDDGAYEKFARTIKTLDDNGYKVDSCNPNNLLIDYQKHEFNIVDYYKLQDWDQNKDNQKNSYLDMVAIMLDYSLLDEYCNLLTEDEKADLIKNANIIHQKAFNAAQKTGLSTDISRFDRYTRHVDKYVPAPRVSYVAQFESLREKIPGIENC